jgi:NADPH:quinone reductase-like Zn-dependent oxidoreductase
MAETMKAWFAVPGPEGAVFELRETPVAAPGLGQVVVAVRAAGTNRGELIRGAALRPGSAPVNPARAGTEFAGEIGSPVIASWVARSAATRSPSSPTSAP